MEPIEKGTIIQVINPKHDWYPSVLIVKEIKEFGVQAYMTIPTKGEAYVRIEYKDLKVVGHAKVQIR